jgi:hypothetical protein
MTLYSAHPVLNGSIQNLFSLWRKKHNVVDGMAKRKGALPRPF